MQETDLPATNAFKGNQRLTTHLFNMRRHTGVQHKTHSPPPSEGRRSERPTAPSCCPTTAFYRLQEPLLSLLVCSLCKYTAHRFIFKCL